MSEENQPPIESIKAILNSIAEASPNEELTRKVRKVIAMAFLVERELEDVKVRLKGAEACLSEVRGLLPQEWDNDELIYCIMRLRGSIEQKVKGAKQ